MNQEDASLSGCVGLNEDFVQWIWREQFLDTDCLRCMDGRPVKVLKAGDYVGGAGPDFRDAVLEIGGFRLQGDVEIHVESRDWRGHHHSGDHAYNRVVLHVFLWSSGDEALTDELHNGIRVPRLELSSFLEPDLDTLWRCFEDDYLDFPASPKDAMAATAGGATLGNSDGVTSYVCHELIRDWDPARREGVLRRAGRRRVEERISRFMSSAGDMGLPECFWSSFLSGLTPGRSRPLMFILGSHVAIDELWSYVCGIENNEELTLAVESILLHVSNLLPSEADSFDGESLAYLDALRKQWLNFSGWYGDRVMKPSKSWHGGMRPATFPERRLAGVARLLTRRRRYNGLLAGFVSEVHAFRQAQPTTASDFRKTCKGLIQALTVEGEGSFWGDHFSFGGKKLTAPQQLIGSSVASSLLFNVVLPYVIIHARAKGDSVLEDFVFRLLSHWPPLSDSSQMRRMRERLFGASAPTKVRLELHQQGLYWLDQTYCANHPCAECPCVQGTSVFNES